MYNISSHTSLNPGINILQILLTPSSAQGFMLINFISYRWAKTNTEEHRNPIRCFYGGWSTSKFRED
jgi:hypothetical protein